jgi:hypothetical protein
MVIEKSQSFRAIPRDFPGSWLSITVLECDFSNPGPGDGFEKEKRGGPGPTSQVRCSFLEPLRREEDAAASGEAGA